MYIGHNPVHTDSIMAMKCVVIVCLMIEAVCGLNDVTATPSFRGPELCHQGLRFNPQSEDLIAISYVPDRTRCALLCSTEATCLSFNYEKVANASAHACEIISNTTDLWGSNMTLNANYIYMEKMNGSFETPSCSKRNQIFEDCTEAYEKGYREDGLYKIKGVLKQTEGQLDSGYLALCNMSDGGGWTVIQKRRGIASDKTFHRMRLWEEYKWGFGNTGITDFWLGNEHLYELTRIDKMQPLLVDLGGNVNRKYEYFDEINVNREFIAFDAMICNDIHVQLYMGMEGYYYEFVIGGWSNTQSAIRRYDNGVNSQKTAPGTSSYCSCSEWRPFWISWHSGVLRVGRGHEYLTNQFMTWTDTYFNPPTKIGFSGYPTSTSNKFRIYRNNYKVRFDFKRTDNQVLAVEYTSFSVMSEADKYKLHICGFHRSLGYYSTEDEMNYHHNQKFTTYDQDNDVWSSQCAQSHNSGWWYQSCFHSDLNRPYGANMNWDGADTIRHMQIRIKRTDPLIK